LVAHCIWHWSFVNLLDDVAAQLTAVYPGCDASFTQVGIAEHPQERWFRLPHNFRTPFPRNLQRKKPYIDLTGGRSTLSGYIQSQHNP